MVSTMGTQAGIHACPLLPAGSFPFTSLPLQRRPAVLRRIQLNNQTEPLTVSALDLERYLGKWYEIARLPQRHEPADYTDINATYSMNPEGTVRVDNRARNGHGGAEESVGEASIVEGSGNAKLEVSFLPEGLKWLPFTKGDYWVLRIDEDYQTALVGTPNRKYLWLLSRAPSIDPNTRQSFLDTAVQQGFELSALIDTPQHEG